MSGGLPSGGAIRTPDRRLRVFVSSTLGELADERRAVERAISSLRLTPVLFELGARPHPPQQVYRAYLAQSDVFIGLYWQNYGQIAAGTQISGIEEEFDLSAELPRLLYVKTPAPDREPRLKDLLSRIEEQASYRGFRTPAELGRLVRDDLATLLSERFAAGRVATPAPSTAHRPPRPLPLGTTSLVGRARAIDDVAELLARPETRLLTLTGPGGIGKTRLAIAVGEQLRDGFPDGIAFVQVAAVSRPEQVLHSIGRAVRADLAGTKSPLRALIEQLGDGRWLLILDNLEQVIEVARDLEELLASCPGVTILATSRTVLRLRAEQDYPVPPLPTPADPTIPLQDLAASPAVALFVERALAVRHDFSLTESNAAAVVEICQRLEGIPLAIELAAARVRLLDPDALLGRLTVSFDTLGTGTVDMPERQQTLRATVAWSVGLLDAAERSLLDTLAVFVGGWTIGAAAEVAGLDEDHALDLVDALAGHSLIALDHTEFGLRSRMLETIRVYIAERLAARPDVAEIRRRHATYYRMLGENADVPLRGAGHHEMLETLDTEAGNMAVAVRWYLDHDKTPLPHLFRVLLPFWSLRDHLSDAHGWIDELLPSADSMDPESRAELVWTALVVALEVGEDAVALAARERLAALLPEIRDPLMRAMSELSLAGTAPIVGDIESTLGRAYSSLEQLRDQDEPFWTALAVSSVGGVETAVGRYDDAFGHLNEARMLADQSGNTWLGAWSRAQLGTLAILQGKPADAQTLLHEGLDLSVAAHNIRSVTMCLVAFALDAFTEGDPQRAALLAGAAEGLRRRAGLQAWPLLRQREQQLVAQIRELLGSERFDKAYGAGAALSQREAVAAVRSQAAPPPAVNL